MNDLDRLAALIKQERDSLLTQWRQQVRQLPSARQLDTPTLNDHIPDLLQELAIALESTKCLGSTFRFSLPSSYRSGTNLNR